MRAEVAEAETVLKALVEEMKEVAQGLDAIRADA